MAFWKESMINRLSNLINRNRSAAKISQVLCSKNYTLYVSLCVKLHLICKITHCIFHYTLCKLHTAHKITHIVSNFTHCVKITPYL